MVKNELTLQQSAVIAAQMGLATKHAWPVSRRHHIPDVDVDDPDFMVLWHSWEKAYFKRLDQLEMEEFPP